MRVWLWILVFVLPAGEIRACIWDADSLFIEKHRSHDLAAAILGEPEVVEDPQKLQARIKDLESNRNEASADWWNNLAGAYLRLNQPAVAVKLLEPVAAKFPDDYGIHANLGTAYHLLGRYSDAEKEIARDLEINPDAHFGLEKYHLALLQYLMRDAKYQSQHVYVDEFSRSFQEPSVIFTHRPDGKLDPTNTNALDLARINELTKEIGGEPEDEKTNSWEWGQIKDLKSEGYSPPPYRFSWDLATDSNFVAGVIYMVQMNPKEPACFEMLGLAAATRKTHDYNLATAAFEKAITLGSLKPELLKQKVDELHHFITESFKIELWVGGAISAIPLAILYYFYTKIRDFRRKSTA